MDASDKKINIEDLSKDDLLKRCKTLVALVQKVKTSKAELEEENAKLTQTTNKNNDAAREVLEKLTEEKLNLVTQVNDLTTKNRDLQNKLKSCEEVNKKYNDLETENISYQRQVTRLTDENEQLLSDLATLESQISELNKLGIEQQHQLLELEKTNQIQLSDLQSKLAQSLSEAQELKDIICIKENKITQLLQDIEIVKQPNTLTNSNTQCDLFDKDILAIKIENENYSSEISEIRNKNDKLKEKLKCYHSKLKHFASTTKEIKQEKSEIIRIFKAYTEQIKDWKDHLQSASRNLLKIVKDLKAENENLKKENTANKLSENEEFLKIKEQITFYETQVEDLQHQLQRINEDKQNEIAGIEKKYSDYFDIQENLLKCRQQLEDLTKELISKEDNYKKELKELHNSLQQSVKTEKQFAKESSDEIIRLANSNQELQKQLAQLQDELKSVKKLQNSSETQTDNCFQRNNSDDNGIDLKRENSELLHEMNQMNQALKERGEIISKLEAHCEEVKKKLQVYETQANRNVDSITEKEEIIKKLSDEIDSLKQKLSSAELDGRDRINSNLDTSYAESETMSTSTISRSEEYNRLKDLDSSWEERYGKLRTLAIKLKAKIKEQAGTIVMLNSEKEELQKKISNQVKTIQNLHEQIDKNQDELDIINSEKKQYVAKLNSIAESISKDKQLLVEKDDLISKLNKENEQLNNDKQAQDNWRKQVGAKVQTLRKELEAKNLVIKDSESKLIKLQSDFENKEKELKLEQENHKQTKTVLEETNSMCKKNSLLNLEMQDYEKTVKDLSQKVEKQKSELEHLQSQLDMQKGTVNALREQNKVLEEQRQEAEKETSSSLQEIGSYKKSISELEQALQQKETKTLDIVKALECARSENEELSTELSKLIAEHQKALNSIKSERDLLRNHSLSLQQNLREALDKLTMREDELNAIKDDYETYKVRAQSVLKKNQNRDLGLEEKLSEEVTTFKSQNNDLQNKLLQQSEFLKSMESNNQELSSENDRLTKNCQELKQEVEDLKSNYDRLSEKYQKTVNEHNESVRNLKVHAETLSQCYRQQLTEQETRHNREIIELQTRIDKAPSPIETTPVHPNMPREEGEGSESTDTHHPTGKVHPVPLERLLDSKSDNETKLIKKQLMEQESKVIHLTALLSDTEQDLAKHVQMNKLLKEEIRRHQRSLEREQHAENLEYLKNVVFKFVTLNSGDERSRLVPVLNTILKLSPEETQKLNMVAKGDPGLKAWASYLPLWSSPSKPQ
ncbi:hypothetical protein GWI33_004758 [Rhynchophorus ferrugineus]|uniref:GRIP domain-containing protein n=1 Tax=Rhynchophorus ferrugineus TaxID=354439 RepID=A0A834MIJ4_RHYFE|nr:hypothetical protein GWI33_004758 [Rhynchophorus ferrugineus]